MSEELKEWGKALVEAFVVLLILYIFLWPTKIDGISMEQTFSHGDRVTMSRFMTKFSFYERGDIIVFNMEEDGERIQVVKRIIAMGGDRVEIKDGRVFVNEIALEEAYAVGETLGTVDVTVPQDAIFVMGDNRLHSFDSRNIGVVAKEKLSGRVLFRWYPFSHIKAFF